MENNHPPTHEASEDEGKEKQMKKREMRIKRHLHQMHRYGQSQTVGMSWARKQASRRSSRRKKTVKSGYTI